MVDRGRRTCCRICWLPLSHPVLDRPGPPHRRQGGPPAPRGFSEGPGAAQD